MNLCWRACLPLAGSGGSVLLLYVVGASSMAAAKARATLMGSLWLWSAIAVASVVLQAVCWSLQAFLAVGLRVRFVSELGISRGSNPAEI